MALEGTQKKKKRRRDNGFDPIYDPNESRMVEVKDAKLLPRTKHHDQDEEDMLEETVIFDIKDLE